MSTMESRSLAEDVLVGGLDDWAYAGWIYGSTRFTGIVDPQQLSCSSRD